VIQSGNRILAGTAPDGISYSDDGGATWSASYYTLCPSVLFIYKSSTKLFAGTGGAGGLNFSTNNGQSWSLIGGPFNNAIMKGMTELGTKLFVCGSIGVYKSSDGISWTSSNSGLTNTYVNDIIAMGSDLYAATNNGIFISSDSGSTWNDINNGMNSIAYTFMVNGNELFAGTGDGVYVTSNQGLNWTQKANGMNGFKIIYDLAMNGSVIIAGTFITGVYISFDNGDTWVLANDGLTNQNVRSVCVSGTDVFIGTVGGGVWKRSFDNLTSLEPVTDEIQDLQVYPNPTISKITVSTNGKIPFNQLKIYSMNGQLVFPSLQEFYTSTIDVASLPKGIYIVEGTCNQKALRKMLVVN
jgi:photosystem II stability/assembly factor-like uncharacterized protein